MTARRPLLTPRTARPLLAALVAAVALATATASIRSPDAEVEFRTAEALALHGTFAVEHDLMRWPEFGLPRGRDGRRYSVFAPLLPLVAAPLVRIVDSLVPPDWVPDANTHVPPSHYFADGLPAALRGVDVAPETARGHLVRAWVSLLDVLVLALIAVAAFDFARVLAGSFAAAWLAGLLLPLGTYLLSYTTNLFSEPLAILATLLGLRLLAEHERDFVDATRSSPWRLAGAGAAFGMAVAAHVSAAVALPFALALAATASGARGRVALRQAAAFALGLAGPLALLAVYNALRFGSPLETGRGLQPNLAYGVFVAPWSGLFGLTVSFGKGLIWFCPLVVVALAAAVAVPRARRRWSWLALAAVATRLVFISARSDWTGGFCVGPRYLLLVLPFALVPPLLAARGRPAPSLRWRIAGALVLVAAIAQQLYFVSGEIFRFEYLMRARGQALARAGGHPQLYADWALSPLHGLLADTRGPVAYRWLPWSTTTSWLLLTGLVGALAVLSTRAAFALDRRPPP